MSARLTGVSWLDWKLGARLLLKYPALTIIGGLSLAGAIAIGAVGFEVANELLYQAAAVRRRQPNRPPRDAGHGSVTRRAAGAPRVPDLAAVAEDGGRARCRPPQRAQRAHGRRPRRIAARSGDHGVGVSARPRGAAARQTAAAGGRKARRRARRRPGSRRLAATVSGRPGDRRPRRHRRPHAPHCRGRDAASVRLPPRPAAMDTVARPGCGAARGAGRAGVRAPRRRRELAGRRGGARSRVGAPGRRGAGHARAAADASRAFAGRTPGEPLRLEDLAVHAIVAAAAGGGVGECRDADLRARGDARAGDGRPSRARGEPCPRGRANRHRRARADPGRCRARARRGAGRHALRVGPGDSDHGGQSAVLGGSEARACHHRLRPAARARCRGADRRAAGTEGHGRVRPAGAAGDYRLRRHHEVRRRLVVHRRRAGSLHAAVRARRGGNLHQLPPSRVGEHRVSDGALSHLPPHDGRRGPARRARCTRRGADRRASRALIRRVRRPVARATRRDPRDVRRSPADHVAGLGGGRDAAGRCTCGPPAGQLRGRIRDGLGRRRLSRGVRRRNRGRSRPPCRRCRGAGRTGRRQRVVHARGRQQSRGRTRSHAPARQRARAGTLARDRRRGRRSVDVPRRLEWGGVHLPRGLARRSSIRSWSRCASRETRGRWRRASSPWRGRSMWVCTSGISSPSTTSSPGSTHG